MKTFQLSGVSARWVGSGVHRFGPWTVMTTNDQNYIVGHHEDGTIVLITGDADKMWNDLKEILGESQATIAVMRLAIQPGAEN